MKEYEKLPRLTSEEKIGKHHIAVERHVSLDYSQHWHNYFEIEIIVSGEGNYIFNGTSYFIGKGDTFLLTPLDFHQIKASSPIEIINISFDDVWLSESIRTFLYTYDFTKIHRFNGADYDHLVKLAELLSYECNSESPCIGQLLEYMLSRFLLKELNQYNSSFSHDNLTGVKKAIAYIELHFREKVTLRRLSEISGYNPTYFSELFRKFTGETYIERLTSLRVNYAKVLLSNGFSVSEACFESGFGSLSNFTAVFSRRCGMPPRDYKKQYFNENA